MGMSQTGMVRNLMIDFGTIKSLTQPQLCEILRNPPESFLEPHDRGLHSALVEVARRIGIARQWGVPFLHDLFLNTPITTQQRAAAICGLAFAYANDDTSRYCYVHSVHASESLLVRLGLQALGCVQILLPLTTLEMVLNHPSARVRCEALLYGARYFPNESFRHVTDALYDDDYLVRVYAIEAIKQNRMLDLLDTLQTLERDEYHPSVQQTLDVTITLLQLYA